MNMSIRKSWEEFMPRQSQSWGLWASDSNTIQPLISTWIAQICSSWAHPCTLLIAYLPLKPVFPPYSQYRVKVPTTTPPARPEIKVQNPSFGLECTASMSFPLWIPQTEWGLYARLSQDLACFLHGNAITLQLSFLCLCAPLFPS